MPTVWFALMKSLHCKSEPSEVHDPRSKKQLGTILTRKKPCRSGCSRTIANLKDVVHGSKKHLEKPCSPRSIGSSEFVNPITHGVILSNSTCELKITGFGGCHEKGGSFGAVHFPSSRRSSQLEIYGDRRCVSEGVPGNSNVKANNGRGLRSFSERRASNESDYHGGSACLICHKCGEQFGKGEGLEAHHLSKHAVTDIVEGDSSRKIIEMICRTSWLKTESGCGRIERVLKVHNMQKTLARFEEYREMVKLRASKLPKKHPRCLADGNELLRFHGTTISCLLGMNGPSSLCNSDKCNVCRIIRHGFSSKKEMKGGIGVFTTSTSGRAFESIELYEDDDDDDNNNASMMRKALIICRVIAGRVHRPLDNYQEFVGQIGFDSAVGKVGLYANIEELYLLNPRALLPCFVVICKP